MAKKKKKKFRAVKLLLTLILFLSLLSVAGIYYLGQKNYEISFINADFTPSTEILSNPNQGWYHSYSFTLDDQAIDKASINEALESDTDTTLCELEIYLDEYIEGEISDEAIVKLETILSLFSTTEKGIILHFCYEEDPEDITLVYLHMEQVAPVVLNYSSSIYILEGVFASEDNEEYTELLAYEAALFESEIYLCASDSAAYLEVSGEKYIPSEIMELSAQNLSSRISIFSSGISLELTTKEAAYLQQLCLYVPSGGKLDADGGMEVFNSALEILQNRQISYLSADCAEEILTSWKDNLYKVDDAFYGISQYEYITAHLGYRYVIEAVETSFNNWSDEEARLDITVLNEGFSVAYERFDFTLLLKSNTNDAIYTIASDSDNRTWAPGEESILTWNVPVKTMGKGSYTAYILVTDNDNGTVIALGNSLDNTNNGYVIGTLEIN